MELYVERRVAIPLAGLFSPVAAAPSLTVLLVTAEANLREAGARALTQAGYRVLTAAHSGHAWLACLRDGTVDILLADLSTHEIAGRALTARLRRLQPQIEPLYFANRGTPPSEDVIVRPFTRDDLMARLDTLAAAVASR